MSTGRTLATLATLAMTTVLTGLASTPAMAMGVNDLPQVTPGQVLASVSDIGLQISDIRVQDSIQDVELLEKQGSETVVTLTTDILFSFGKSELPTSATARIVSLVAKAPRGGALNVGGHTDNVGSSASNLTLSKKRATAVAAVIAAARPDLRLAVRGFGESSPVTANETGGKVNPQGRAQNRRVELRFRG